MADLVDKRQIPGSSRATKESAVTSDVCSGLRSACSRRASGNEAAEQLRVSGVPSMKSSCKVNKLETMQKEI